MDTKIKCLIADDEQLFREYLKNVVDWEEQGFSIVGEARDGMEALELAENAGADVLFVDIDMPLKSGLDMICELQQKHIKPLCVLITGHGKFDYARRAIQLGVFDYLLKPFSREELSACLMKIKVHFSERNPEDSKDRNIYALARTRLLQQVICGEYSGTKEGLSDMFTKYMIPLLLEKPVIACALKSYDYSSLWVNAKEKIALQYGMENILREVIGPDEPFVLFSMDDNLRSLLFNIDSKDVFSRARQLEHMRLLCKERLQINMTIGVGNPYPGPEGFRISWLEAVTAQNYNLQKNLFAVTLQRDISDKKLNIIDYYRILNRSVPTYLNNIQNGIPEKASYSYALMVKASQYMYRHYMEDLTLEKIARALFVSSSYLRKVFMKETNSSVMSMLQDIRMNTACQLLIDGNSSISNIAEMVGFKDPAYFSRVFKNYFGITPSEFEVIRRERDE
jgi:AraC-like DNA-binding protein/FixJ family two-component response regulator